MSEDQNIRIRKTISITQYDQELINDIIKDSENFNWARPGEIKESTIIQRAIRCYHSIIFPKENDFLKDNEQVSLK